MADVMCVPFVGGIIERLHDGRRQLLIQTRFKSDSPSMYNGTLEFAAGKLDQPYENVYEAIAREIKEETGLTLRKIIDDSRTDIFTPQGVDASFGFRPFCCVQQLKEGRPWVGFVYRCEVDDGEPTEQESESRDVHWEDYATVKKLFETTPEKLFTLEVPALAFYFQEVSEYE